MVWSDDTVVECISTKFGTFGVIAEIYEPPHVEDDQNWLLITKMIGYGFSIILLGIFGFSILASKGQLISKCHFVFFKTPKKQTKFL